MPAAKLDLFKDLKAEYTQSKKPVILETTSGNYLTISGKGAPAGDVYTNCVEALYAMAFGVKMASKKAGRDYVVAKMEGLWWGPSGSSEGLIEIPREEWQWKMMIRNPDWIIADDVAAAAEVAIKKGKTETVNEVVFEAFHEGTVVQALHVGPYAEETPLIMSMFEFAAEHGYKPDGLHHEIYLSDPRRVEPARLKTILRHPVCRIG